MRFAALAPIIAACAAGDRVSASAAHADGLGRAALGRAERRRRADRHARADAAVPSPEAELHIWNYAEYMGEDVIPSFVEKIKKDYKVDIKVSSDFFDTYEGMYAQASPPARPASTSRSRRRPTSRASSRSTRSCRSTCRSSRTRSTSAPNGSNPGYDPGNAHSMPYMWWTTGVAYDTAKIKEAPTSWKALWDERWKGHIAMLDDQREAFAAALIQLNFSANTVDDGELDQALALLKQQHPLVRLYSVEDQQYMASGDIWIGHAWGSDIYTVQQKKPSVEFYIPEEGSVRGSDAAVILDGAKNPVAANLFINHLLDAHVSAENSNYIGYMGPNEAAKAVHHQGPPRHALDQPGQGHRRQAPGAAGPGPRHRTSTRRAGPS